MTWATHRWKLRSDPPVRVHLGGHRPRPRPPPAGPPRRERAQTPPPHPPTHPFLNRESSPLGPEGSKPQLLPGPAGLPRGTCLAAHFLSRIRNGLLEGKGSHLPGAWLLKEPWDGEAAGWSMRSYRLPPAGPHVCCGHSQFNSCPKTRPAALSSAPPQGSRVLRTYTTEPMCSVAEVKPRSLLGNFQLSDPTFSTPNPASAASFMWAAFPRQVTS